MFSFANRFISSVINFYRSNIEESVFINLFSNITNQTKERKNKLITTSMKIIAIKMSSDSNHKAPVQNWIPYIPQYIVYPVLLFYKICIAHLNRAGWDQYHYHMILDNSIRITIAWTAYSSTIEPERGQIHLRVTWFGIPSNLGLI